VTTKHCNVCEEDKPVDQFRMLKPQQPGWASTRHSWCKGCERESARLRAAKRYHDDPEWREKQLANAAIQNTRRSARAREQRETGR
jgi:hypothetical protein